MAGPAAATLQIHLQLPALSSFTRAEAVLKAPFGGERGKAVVEALRASVRAEFEKEAWSLPGGGTRGWEAVEPFGKREPAAGGILGGPGGAIAQAWLGSAPENSTHRVAIFSTHPGGAVHRGGDDPSGDETTEIPVTAKMRAKLGLAWDVWLKYSTSHVVVPARPHATRNPALEAAIVAVLSRALTGAKA